MRLEHDVYFAKPALPCGGQGGADFGGVVAVIVDHAYPGSCTPQLETAIDAAKVF